LEPSVPGGDNGIRVGAPDEGLGLAVIVLGDEAVDGAQEIGDREEHAMLQAPAGALGEKACHRVQPRAGVGVKWIVQHDAAPAIPGPWRACGRRNCRG